MDPRSSGTPAFFYRSYFQRDTPNLVLGPNGQASIVDAGADQAGIPDISPQESAVSPDGARNPGVVPFASIQQTQTQLFVPAQSGILPSPTFSQLSQLPVSAIPALAQSTASVTGTEASLSSASSVSAAITATATSLVQTALAATLSSASASSSSSPSTSIVSIPTHLTPSPTPTPKTESHSAPFYVAIILGAFCVVACVSAFIAWWIRSRSRTRQRRELEDPWGSGTGGLEEGREPSLNEDDGASHQTSEYYLPESIVQRNTAEAFSSSITIPNANEERTWRRGSGLAIADAPFPPVRPLPSKVVSALSVQESTHTLGPLQVANLLPGDLTSGDEGSRQGTVDMRTARSGGVGTPREEVPGAKPRFLSLEGDGLSVPWAGLRDGSVSLRTRRPMDNGTGNNARWKQLPMPGEAVKHPEDLTADGWTSTLKSNLMNAFSAVAGNRPAPSSSESVDRFTPIPQRTSPRRSPDQRWGQQFPEHAMARTHSASSGVSRLYTLHETGDGAGVVHIRGMDNYAHAGERTWSPGPSRSTLQFGDSQSTLRPGITPVWTRESQAPLLANEVPAARTKALPRPSRYNTRPSITSTGSIYSAESAIASANLLNYGYDETRERPLPSVPNPRSRTSTLRSAEQASTKSSSRKRERRKRSRPKPIQRVSSSTSSVLSFGSDLTRPGQSANLSIREDAARKALMERRRRMAMNALSSDD